MAITLARACWYMCLRHCCMPRHPQLLQSEDVNLAVYRGLVQEARWLSRAKYVCYQPERKLCGQSWYCSQVPRNDIVHFVNAT